MFTSHEIIQIFTAGFGSLGFALLFNVRRRFLAACALNGAAGWIVYLLSIHLGANIFAASFFSTLWIAIYAEIFARVLKTPANQFLIVGLIPLVPGAPLYRAMRSFVEENSAAFKNYSDLTVKYVLGIAAGICLVYSFQSIFHQIEVRRKKQKS